jgi:N-acetylneuraminate synthase
MPVTEEEVTIAFAFASVVATRDLQAGEVITREDITLKRPNGGDFGPKEFESLLGATVASAIKPNIQITRSQIVSSS